ncbi:MAG: hypothetical protein SA339_05135 [Methanomassiliicoccus sp.]|nr:hypothetical protein [Methanomassiliicoccus sp.]
MVRGVRRAAPDPVLSGGEPLTVIDGDWEEDHYIRDRYNAGVDPGTIAEELGNGRRITDVTRRLKVLERDGEVRRRKGNVFTYGYRCLLPHDQRFCFVLKPGKNVHKCVECEIRGTSYRG